MPENDKWTRDELLLALNGYLQFGISSADEEFVIDLSKLLRSLHDPNLYPDPSIFRNPTSTATAINSFAPFDPTYVDFGFVQGSELEEEIWEEFAHDLPGLSKRIERIIQNNKNGEERGTEEEEKSSTQNGNSQEPNEPRASSPSSKDHITRLIGAFRDRLIDLSRRNRLINFRHSETSNTHLRLVNCGLNDLLAALTGSRSLEFTSLPRHEFESLDEQSDEFRFAYEAATTSDMDYLDRLRLMAQEGSDDPDSQQALDRELKDRVRDQLGLPPRQSNRTASPSQIAAASGINPSYTLDFDFNPTQHEYLRQIQTLFASDRMDAKLGKLRDTARRSIEETGVNRLYLALGFLEWYESEHTDRPNFAPLLVISTNIDRQSSENRWRYFMKGEGEFLKENIALRIRLAGEGIDLPEFDVSYSLERYFEIVRTSIEQKEKWKVHNFATVGLFAFSNIELWNDLDPKNWPANPIEENSNFLSLFGSGEASAEMFAEEYEVDSPEISSQLPPLVLDADSSQLSAVIDAVAGKNLAIKGPPGTGKSQTIANLIAAFMFAGKRVLFVAEKLAALDVVKKRLDDVGLGDFVLELHSSKAHTRNLISSLDKRMEIHTIPLEEPELESKRNQLESYRDELNEYAHLLNFTAGACGKTIHEVLWASPNRSFIYDQPKYRNFEIAKPETLRSLELEQSKYALEQFESNATQIESDFGSLSEHPWHWVGNAVDAISRRQLIDRLIDWIALQDELDILTDRLEANGMQPDLDTPELQQSLLEWIDNIPTIGTEVDSTLIPHLAHQQTNDLVRLFLEHLSTRDELIKSSNFLKLNDLAKSSTKAAESNFENQIEHVDWHNLSERIPEYIKSVSDANTCLKDIHTSASQLDLLIKQLAPIMEIDEALSQVDFISEHLALLPESINRDALLNEISEITLSWEADLSVLRTFLEERRNLSAVYGLTENPKIGDLHCLLSAASLLAETNDEVFELRSSQLIGTQVLSELRQISSRAKAISAKRDPLASLFRLNNIESTGNLIDQALTLSNSGLFGRILPKFNEAKMTWMRLSLDTNDAHTRRSKDRIGMASDLRSIVASIEETDAFVNDKRNIEVVGVHFDGLHTNFEVLIEACGYMNSVRSVTQNEGELGEHVRMSLERGSLAELAKIKRWANSGSLDRIRDLLGRITHSDQSSIEQQIDDLETRISWFKELQDLADPVRFADAVTLNHLPEIISLLRSFSDVASELAKRKENLEEVEQCRFEFQERREIVAATLDFSNQLIDSVGNDAKLSHRSLFSESIVTIVAELKELRKVLASWIAKEREIIQWVEAICDQETLELYFRPTDRSFAAIKDIFSASVASPDTIGSWARFVQSSDTCVSEGLAEYVKVRDSSDGFKISVAYDAIFWHSLAKQVLNKYPALKQFSGHTQANVQKRFSDLDRDILALNQLLIAKRLVRNSRYKLTSGLRSGSRSTWTEMSLINVLIPQTRPRAPIRDILRRAGKSVQTLMPCFMMSPNSVAQFLEPRGIHFDVLIVDEASQMRPEEAIGSVARSDQSIVVGDPMQLPPTPFFTRVDTLDEDLEEDVEDESILDRALASYSPYRELRWHYRSRHHDLINFSNRHFYQDRLIVFPSPEAITESDLGVRYHKVAGTYLGRGGNPEEAKIVAAATIRALKEKPDWSIGVVAINKEQTDQIRVAFDQLLLRDRRARTIWDSWEGTLFPGFIKNLENVQGDERDRIIISTVYGPNLQGRVMQQFGPIVMRNGHRRLNVLFTRARRRVDLYSSMSSSDIRSDERSSLGVKAFGAYLEYAATLRLDAGSYTGREPDSEFEIYVADALQSKGYEVVPQVGVAGFFIDIGIRHPSYPHGFLAGIECDGASYHSSRSAKDRDCLRQEILEGLGWDIYRVWSTDWFNDPRGETQNLINYLDELLDHKLSSQEHHHQESSVDETTLDDDSGTVIEDESDDQESGFWESEDGSESPENQDVQGRREDRSEIRVIQEPMFESEDIPGPMSTRLDEFETEEPSESDPGDPETVDQSSQTKRRLTEEEARAVLVNYREDVIAPRHPLMPRSEGLLRNVMLDLLLAYLPTTHNEFLSRIPDIYRDQTDRVQINRYLDHVLSILARIDSD